MKHKSGTDSEWQSLKAAAIRLDKSVGHLCRLCFQRLRAEGKARWVTGGGKKGHWEICTNATLAFRRSGADLESIQFDAPAYVGGVPIQITIGDVTITIQSGKAPAVPTPGTGQREAFKRSPKTL